MRAVWQLYRSADRVQAKRKSDVGTVERRWCQCAAHVIAALAVSSPPISYAVDQNVHSSNLHVRRVDIAPNRRGRPEVGSVLRYLNGSNGNSRLAWLHVNCQRLVREINPGTSIVRCPNLD